MIESCNVGHVKFRTLFDDKLIRGFFTATIGLQLS